MATIKALGEQILVLPEELEETTTSGIYVAATSEKPNKGKVINFGTEVSAVNENDIIIYIKGAGEPLEHDGENYLFLKEKDVLGVINIE